jgi:hypothetical protein
MEENTMASNVSPDGVYAPSEDVVARDIAGELIIVPLASGIGDLEDELFTLNDTGRAIWEKLDGKRTLRQVAAALAEEYEASAEEIETDVVGLVGELFKRGIVVEGSSA